MVMQFLQQKYDPKTGKYKQTTIKTRATIEKLGSGLLTRTKDISKSTVDLVKRPINRGK